MKSKYLSTTLNNSILACAIALSTSTFAATQEQRETEQAERETTAIEPQSGHSIGTEDECSNAPNNVGQGAVENAQPSNPNAPIDIQGSRGQTNPSTGRAENDELAQLEDNCYDAHEDPHTNENVRNPDPTGNNNQQ